MDCGQQTWISPPSILSSSPRIRPPSSFWLHPPRDVANASTGRPQWPYQRRSIGLPSAGLSHRWYSRITIDPPARSGWRNRSRFVILPRLARGTRPPQRGIGVRDTSRGGGRRRRGPAVWGRFVAKSIGILYGRERSFPPALEQEINRRGDGEVVARAVRVGALRQ